MKHSKSRLAITLLTTVVLAATVPAVASASDTPDMQERVNAALAEIPGGVQTGWNEVTWDDGAMVLTIAGDDGGPSTYSI